jgi:hypothetical protein
MTEIANDDRPNIADEDMAILVAIHTNMVQQYGTYELKIPGGATLTNKQDGKQNFSFAGIDAIKNAHTQIMLVDAQTPHEIVMPSGQFTKRIKIGEMFGMPLYADPECPKDRFLIRQIQEEEKSDDKA